MCEFSFFSEDKEHRNQGGNKQAREKFIHAPSVWLVRGNRKEALIHSSHRPHCLLSAGVILVVQQFNQVKGVNLKRRHDRNYAPRLRVFSRRSRNVFLGGQEQKGKLFLISKFCFFGLSYRQHHTTTRLFQ